MKHFFFSLLFLFTAPLLLAQPTLEDKIEGMLIGSVIGDAAGGPTEFATPERSYWSTTDQKITAKGLEELASLFRLRDYPRPAEPFGVWDNQPPAGTITDDSRLKIILFNALKESDGNLTDKALARATLDFGNHIQNKYKAINKEWMQEIGYASRWVLGERENAYPTERIWGGVPTVMGSMALLPIAGLYPNQPESAYLKAYEVGYFDNGSAKDINSAIVAGLSRALAADGNWKNVEEAMRAVDPYGYNKTTYVSRATTQWLDLAHGIVERADGNLATLFTLLESDLKTIYWWEAWVPLVVVFSVAEFTDYHPLASMQILIEFGHDTDSYMQVMGAYLGAIHGKDIFPKEMRDTVNEQMKLQFDTSVPKWMDLIERFSPK